MQAKPTLLPIGTVVYTFRDNPFVVLKGKVIGYGPREALRYYCEYLDSTSNQTFKEHTCHPYVTAREAKASYDSICKALFGLDFINQLT